MRRSSMSTSMKGVKVENGEIVLEAKPSGMMLIVR